jgi:hypothetical protein
MKTKIIVILTSIFLLISLLALLFGPGFPFCPIIIGFKTQDIGRAEIFYHDKQYLDPIKINLIIEENELLHGLKYKDKVQIVLTDSSNEFYRLTLNQFRFTTFPPFGRVIVSGRNLKDFEEGKIHIYTYLKHELSHALIFQNSKLIEYFNGNIPTWFLEGLATYYSDMVGVDVYPNFSYIKEKIKQDVYISPYKVNSGFLAPESEEIKKLNISSKWPFLYSEFALVVYEIDKDFGRKKLKMLIGETGKGKSFYYIFNKIYGIDFNIYWNNLVKRIKSES